MRKIYSLILVAAAILSFAPLGKAQTETKYENGLGFSKNVSKPDDEGVYTITLEAFTTGKVEIEKKSVPADIVLVLDVSGSMNYALGDPVYESAGNKRWTVNDIQNASTFYWYRDSWGDYYRVSVSNYGNLVYVDGDSVEGSLGRSWYGTLYTITNSRIAALKEAVNGFLEIINTNDLSKDGDERLGNRVSIVTFSTYATRHCELIKLGDESTNEKSADDGLKTLQGIVNGLTAMGGTYAHKGMEEAKTLLNLPDNRQLRTTVLFTDGDPGLRGNWTSSEYFSSSEIYNWPERETNYNSYRIRERVDTYNTANATINYANDIKGYANDAKRIVSNVWTVSIIPEAQKSNQTTVYLGKTSSNWTGATTMGDWTDSWNNTTTMWNNGNGDRGEKQIYALSAETTEQLLDAFEKIGTESGGTDAQLGSSSITVVDVVSTSFMLPPGADASNIEVWTAPCNGGSENAWTFADSTKAPDSKDKYDEIRVKEDGTIEVVRPGLDVDDAIRVELSSSKGEGGKLDKITVKNFDYFSNFCGSDGQGGFRGHKVIIKIPVKMDTNAVGGPQVNTNESTSGIFSDLDGDGVPDPIIHFISPKVDLPVNIFIQKNGLNLGESAKFKIQRIPAATPLSEDWEDVTSVFLTRSTDDNPIVKIRGLDPNYIYQVVEENWSWSYTSMANTATRTDRLITNPFRFTNTPVDKQIRHAESKAINDFSGTGSFDWVDSKKNNRNGSESGSGTGSEGESETGSK